MEHPTFFRLNGLFYAIEQKVYEKISSIKQPKIKINLLRQKAVLVPGKILI